MSRRILMLLVLTFASSAFAREPLWEPQGMGGSLTLYSDSQGGASATLALPPTGNWRVSALELDGHALDPEGLAWVSPPGMFRRIRVGGVALMVEDRPWDEARLQIRFEAPFPAERFALDDPMVAGLLVNADQASPARLPSESSDRDGDEIFDGTSNWIRLDYKDTGFYRLSYSELTENGMPLGVDPATFRLLGRPAEPQPFRMAWGGSWERGWALEEIPIRVNGEASFGPDTEIICYLPGQDGWATELDAGADPAEWRRHPYAVWSTVYLTWGGEEGLRPGSENVAPGGAPLLESITRRLHREQNLIYSNQDLHEDGWAWIYFLRSESPDLFADVAPLVWPLAGEPFSLTVGFDKPSLDGTGGHSHHLRCYLGSVNNQPDPAGLLIDEEFTLSGTTSWKLLSGEGVLPNLVDGQEDLDFWLELPKEQGEDFGYLLWYELLYETRLRTRNDLPIDFHLPGGDGVVELSIEGWSQEPLLWDTSDPFEPRQLTGGVFADGALNLELDASLPRNLSLFKPGVIRSFLGIRQTAPAPLRHDALPHMIVVYHDDFSAPAQRYVNWRSENFPEFGTGEVEMVAISDVYANFSGGMQDVAGLRNFLKYRYETSGSRLCFVLFLGDADSDYRNFSARETTGDGTNCLIPALSDRFRSERQALIYTTDDYFAYMDAQDDSLEVGLVDLAIGRMPVATLADANQMMDMFIQYDANPPEGLWKGRAVLAADDFFDYCDPLKPDGIQHTNQAEILVEVAMPWDLALQKIYLCEYDCDFAGSKLEAQSDLLSALGDGALFFNYVGHGGNDLLADERLLVEQNIYSMNNGGKRFFFISASCNVGEFDDPGGQSMSELMISLPQGGAIGTMAASALTGAVFNNRLNKNFLQQLFPDRQLVGSLPLSQALMRAKVATQVIDYGGGGYGGSTERYAILGDPALSLASADFTVEFEADSVDSLVVGGHTVVRGRIMRDGIFAPDFDGDLHLSVRASADTSGYDYVHNQVDKHQDYHLAGQEAFRGSFPVVSGEFESPAFFFPRGSEPGPYGEIRAFGSGDGEAVGRLDSVPVVEGELPDDSAAPEVSLSLAGGAVNATPGTPLTVRASDESGINLIGGSPRTALFVEYVESGEVEELTDRFEYDSGSATEGSAVSAIRSGLDPGHYTLVASVADNLGNVGRDTLRVRILEEGRYDLTALRPFPNPFRERCAVTFELTAQARVTLDIFTLSGRKIRSLELDCPEAGRHAFDWDGLDESGDEIANGTYLYRVQADFDGEGLRMREQNGALVKMSHNP